MQNLGLIFLIIALAAGFGTGLSGALKTAQNQNWGEHALLPGARALAFEKAFDETLKIRNHARDFWGIAEFGLFRDGRKDVIVGKDGWLFSAEEFTWPQNAAAQTEKNLDYVTQTARQLRAQGVYVKILLVPAKARLYENYLSSPYPAARAGLYTLILSKLRHAGLDVLDAQSLAYVPNAFFKTDTHWKAQGSLHAANLLFPNAAEQTQPPLVPAPAHTGDLMRYVPLGPFAAEFGYAPEPAWQVNAPLPEASSANDLFGDAGPAIHLVGTSYSADARWGFAQALETASGQTVLNFAAEAQGPFRAMQNYLKRQDISRPATLVWEIPERYFPLFEGQK